MEPLANKLRPKKISDVLGQKFLVGPNGVVTKLIKNRTMKSMILYGTPGIGKTTIATVIANELNWQCFVFNASCDNKQKLKDIISQSKLSETIVIVDEIHRMKADIQDYLLPFVEKGDITIIGLTTVSPYMSVNAAIRSRCLVYHLKELTKDELKEIFPRALSYYSNEITISDEAMDYVLDMSNGEVRTLINMIDVLFTSLDTEVHVDLEYAKNIIQKPSMSYDKNQDGYYDTLSGLHKSIRGSDVNASLHYMAKLLEVEDFKPLIRRLYCIFYEDISLANPNLGPRIKAACEAAMELGLPEARLPFASIVVDMALSPKSNSTQLALEKATKDIQEGRGGHLPIHLRNVYSFDKDKGDYLFPHDYPGGWVDQQYLPDTIKNARYYEPKQTSKYESALKERYDLINKMKTK